MSIREFFQGSPQTSASSSVALIPARFLHVFREHGIEASQIPRFLPQLRLSDLISEQSLLAVLDHDLLEQTAELFNVRIEWLEGVDDVIYDFYTSYNHPEVFFETLAKLRWNMIRAPVRVIASNLNLDCEDETAQPIALVMLDEIAQLGDSPIYRYRVESGEWNWRHAPCRLQLKAMARLAYQKLRIPLPIFKVKHHILEAICEGKVIPGSYVQGCICPDPSLEDFGMTREESVVAKETQEIPLVLKFIEDHHLEEISTRLLSCRMASETSEEVQPSKPKSAKAMKAAAVKNEEGNKLKQTFIARFRAHIEAGEISLAEAARQFYDGLNESQMKALCRSSQDYDNSTADELRLRAIRTLGNAFRVCKT